MARFVYRLQKIFELRERRVKEQEQVVIKARYKVAEVKARIEEKRNEIMLLRQNMMTAPHTLLASHDEYIHKCNEQLDELYEELKIAQAELLAEAKKLAQYQADFKALEKSKEKAREEWAEEEKRAEMKQLDEIASQRYFRAKLQAQEEADDERQQWIEEHGMPDGDDDSLMSG